MKIKFPLFRKIKYFILLGLSGLVVLFSTVLSGSFGVNWWQDQAFWIEFSLFYAAIVLMIVSLVMLVEDELMDKNEDYKEANESIINFSKYQYSPTVFSKWRYIINRRRKIHKYSMTIKKKIAKLEQKATEKQNEVWVMGSEETKKTCKYCKKRRVLEKQLSEEWIENNIDKMRIKYDPINIDILIGGKYHKAEEDEDDMITKNKGWVIFKKKIAPLIMTFSIGVLGISIIVEFSFQLESLYVLFVKMMLYTWHFILTINFANNFFDSVTLKDALLRSGYVQEHIFWMKKEINKKGGEDNGNRDGINTRAKGRSSSGQSRDEKTATNLKPLS